MGMMNEDDQITSAGLLLCDQGYLPQSKIVCTRWKGKENRSVAEPAQTSIDFEKTQSTFEKTQLGNTKTQLMSQKAQLDTEDRDWEMIYFKDVFLKEHGQGLQKKAIDRLVALLDRYRYSYNFNRRNIADLFSITENAGSRFLKTCLDRNIIHKIKTDEYCFITKQE